MSSSTEVQATPTATPTTTTSATGSTSSSGSGGGGRSVQRRSLRSMSYDEGAAALAPVQRRENEATPATTTAEPTTATTTEPTTAASTTAETSGATTSGATSGETTGGGGHELVIPPHMPQPLYRDPTRDPTFRQNTLRWANGNIARIRELMATGVFDWAVTDGEAIQAMQILGAMPTVNRLVVMQELMSTSAGQTLFDNLPGSVKSGAWRPIYLSLAVAANRPEVMRQMVAEQPCVDPSRDAPLLARGMAMLTEADIRREADKVHSASQSTSNTLNQWIGMTPNPPKDDLQTRFTAAAETAQRNHAAQEARATEEAATTAASNARMQGDQGFRDNITTIQGLLNYGVFDWAITDAEARRVFRIFTGLSASDVRNAVNQLDRGPFMDRFLDNLPTADRYGPSKLKFLEILSARTPEHNVRFVTQLLSYGVFDWAVSGDEARLAFTIVKTMPADVQRAFQDAQDGQWWQRMEGNIDQAQANDRDMSLYSNEGQVGLRKAEFETNCATWDAGRLKTTLEMLCRMGQDQFVYDTLKSKGVLAVASNAWIGQTYGFLADHREQVVYDAWIQNRAGDANAPGFFQQAGAIAATIGSVGAGLIDHAVTGDDVDVDLNRTQTAAGGEMAGAVMADRQNEGDNRISVGGEWLKGHVTLRGQQLNIASYSGIANGTTTQTGPISVSGIDVDFKWPTERDPASFVKIKIPLIMARDIALMSRDAMTTVGAFTLTGLNIEARTPTGTAPTSAAEGATLVMGEVQRTINKLMGMIRGANPQPDQIASQLTGAFSEMQAVVRLDSIVAERIGGSDGSYVERAEVRNAAITVQNSRKGPTIRARLAELATAVETRPLTAAEQTEKTTLETNLVLVGRLEEEERSLAQREAARTLEPADRDRLAQVRSELTISRASVTIDELNVRNVNAAGVHADDAHLGNISVEVGGEQRTGSGSQSDAHAEVSVGTMSAHGVTQGDRQIGDVSGSDIHASVSTNAQGTNANLHVGALDVNGAQQGEQGGGDMHLRGLDVGVTGGANLLTAGADLAGQEIGLDLRLGNLAMNNLHFNGSGMTLEAPSTALSDFRVGARVRVERDPQGAYTVVPVMLNNFDVGRLNASNLHVIAPVAGEQADIRVPQAAIVGLHVANVPLENFNPVNLTGAVSVESIQTQMTAQIGPHFQAHGSMSVSDLRATALEAGGVNLHLGDLTFEDMGFTADDSIDPASPLAKLRGMGGQITRLGGIRGDATIDRQSGAVTFDAAVGDFNMASLNYHGGGNALSITGGVRMTGATVRGTAQLDPAAMAGGTDAPPPHIVISELRVPRIAGTGIHFQGGSTRADLQTGYLEDIRIRDLDLTTNAGDFHLGRAGVENLSLATSQALTGGGGQRVIQANVSAHISGVDVARANNGRTTFAVASMDANATGSVEGGGVNAHGNGSANLTNLRGTVGADGSTSASVGSANVDVHAEGSANGTSGNIDAHLDAHNASGTVGANGDTHVELGQANARVSGNAQGNGASGQFNLDMRNLGANVDITSTGFATTVTLGSISLGNTRIAAGDKMLEMGRGAALTGVNVRIAAQTTANGIGAIKIENFSFNRLSADQLHVVAGQIEMSLDHAHIDGFSLTGMTIPSTGPVTTGHIAVAQINASAIQAQVGTTMEGHAGGFTGSGLSLDILGNEQYAFRLADVEAHAVGAAGGGAGGQGSAELEWLRLHGISYDGGPGSGGDLNVQSAGFAVSAQGSGTGGGNVGAGRIPDADGVRDRYDLPFLSHLGGQVGVDIPIGSDRVAGALVVADGRVRVGPSLESVQLPGENYWGWAPKWLVARMIAETAGHLVDYFNPKFLELRGQVEAHLATRANSSRERVGVDLNAQTLSSQLVDSMGRYATALDVASPTGPGILRTARREVGTWVTEHNPFNPDADADAAARREQDRDRHIQQLVDWVRMIALNIDLTGAGGFTAFKDDHAWLQAQAQASLAAHGTLATEMRLGMHVGLSNVQVDAGGMQIMAQQAQIDASLGASATSGSTGPGGTPVEARGNAGVTGSASGITVRLRGR